jgi:hypothetical protein
MVVVSFRSRDAGTDHSEGKNVATGRLALLDIPVVGCKDIGTLILCSGAATRVANGDAAIALTAQDEESKMSSSETSRATLKHPGTCDAISAARGRKVPDCNEVSRRVHIPPSVVRRLPLMPGTDGDKTKTIF